MKKIRLGIVGLGQRGRTMIPVFLQTGYYEIVALCDEYEDRVEQCSEIINKATGNSPKKYARYEDMLEDKDIEVMYIASSWESHIKQAIMSMRKGIRTAMEVGGAVSIDECYDLVSTYQETKVPFTMFENCCFDKFELLSTSLVRKGMLGEIVHCHGAYSHDLRDEILGGNVNRHYRLRNYISRNCENYPTHELGPIAKLLNINRGNRMMELTSMASKGIGLKEFSKDERNPDKSLINQDFKQGDVVSTIIKCANGETITLTLDTTLPKYYSREFTVRGTKGLANQECNMVLIEGKDNMHEFFTPSKTVRKNLDNAEEYQEYLPKYWRNITDRERELGHGGMDYYMLVEYAKSVKNGKQFGIDVYDAAAWMSITPLSAISIENGGKSIKIPDFTRGRWKERKPKDVVKL